MIMLSGFLFARPIIGLQAGYSAPSPPPPPPSPHHSSCHFFNGPFLINNSLVLADVLKSILGISRTDLWSQASFFIKPTRGGRGGAHLFQAHLRGGGLIKTRGNGSLTTIFI